MVKGLLWWALIRENEEDEFESSREDHQNTECPHKKGAADARE